MSKRTFIRRIKLPVAAEEAFAWHERPGSWERMIPTWKSVELLGQYPGIKTGTEVEFLSRIGPFSFRWLVEHRDYEASHQFRDVALKGPFPLWDHLHCFTSQGRACSVLEDRIEYVLPGGTLGELLAATYVERQLARIFRYRHDTLAADLATHSSYAKRPRMKIGITGSSGLIGSALCGFLTSGGHRVQRISRHTSDKEFWKQTPLCADAIVHLAGESIIGRWTSEKKSRIRSSRVEGSEALCRWMVQQPSPPKTLICASAIGFYGNRGGELLDEQSSPGTGFLADTVQAWEHCSREAQSHGIRVVFLRFGQILSPKAGALAKMYLPFRYGLGAKIGSGQQYWSWISIDDVLGIIYHALMNDSLSGPVNAVAPNAVTNAEFAATLGSVLARPVFLDFPAPAIKAILGEMGKELLLSSTRVVPKVLLDSAYQFRHAELSNALRHLFGRE
ncbi:MAG: TIGR01777 family oxidoreductase [Thermoguttaceae bacterium]